MSDSQIMILKCFLLKKNEGFLEKDGPRSRAGNMYNELAASFHYKFHER